MEFLYACPFTTDTQRTTTVLQVWNPYFNYHRSHTACGNQPYCQANHIDHLVVVADAAMLSAKNLDALDAAGIDYIVADRLRKAPYAIELTDADLAVSERDTSVYALVETTIPRT